MAERSGDDRAAPGGRSREITPWITNTRQRQYSAKDSLIKPIKGAAVLISFIAGLAWADGSILCPCPQPSAKASPAYFTGDAYLDLLLQGISPAGIADGTLQSK